MSVMRSTIVLLLCVSAAFCANSTAPAGVNSTATANATAPAPARLAETNGTSATAQGPVSFAATTEVTASAPNPSASVRVRTGNYALDSLAATPTSYNQIQTIGVYSAAHVAPEPAIQDYLSTVVNDVEGLVQAYAPNSTEFTQDQLYNQLEFYGARSFHFPIYYDPTGTTYQEHAGLKIVNQTANTSIADPKWGYPGWKVMNEPNFDFNTSCTTLVTCLFNIKNWLLSTPATVPLTIFLEPSGFTYTGNGTNTTFADALARSNQTGGPDSLAQPVDILTYEPTFQPWRDLENELLNVFDRNSYFTLVTPDDVMDDEDSLAEAVLKPDFTLYPALKDLRSRIFFVLTGDYVSNYLEYYPDLKNATMFVSEPYNAQSNYTNSTLYVDFLGTLPGVNASSYNTTAARNASSTIATEITKTVQAGYMVRAAADWETIEPRSNFSARATDVIQAGAHFVQTSFPTTPTFFPSTFSVALPIRGNQKQSTRCNPLTTGGVYFNATEVYSVGCPALDNAPASAPAASETVPSTTG